LFVGAAKPMDLKVLLTNTKRLRNTIRLKTMREPNNNFKLLKQKKGEANKAMTHNRLTRKWSLNKYKTMAISVRWLLNNPCTR
jgi:hypothetical protein